LLTEIVQDGRRLLSLAEQGKEQHPEHAEAIQSDAALLRRLITQDVEEKPEGGCQVKSGTEKDRVLIGQQLRKNRSNKENCDLQSERKTRVQWGFPRSPDQHPRDLVLECWSTICQIAIWTG
jgi:hypothetical protein